MFGLWCISCYNRVREVYVGRDRKGSVPRFSHKLKSFEVIIHGEDTKACGSNAGMCA